MSNLYIIKQRFIEHITLVQQVAVSNILEQIAESAVIIKNSLKNGKKVLFCGNGGSAADSQHLAAEFVGRFQKERVGLPAIANDYGYDTVFARQVQALGNDGDVLVGLSTSGNSKNVLAAIDVAKAKGMQCIGLTAQGGGKMAEVCDICMAVPGPVTARAQEIHILIGHILCELVDGE